MSAHPRQGRLEGKVAIVTGSGSTPGPGMGTGKATAIVMAREGAKVVVVDVHADRAEDTRRIIEDEEGGTAHVFVGDMGTAAGCRGLLSSTLARFGTVDVLVNNIGVAFQGDVLTTGEEEWDRIMGLTLRTTFLVSKHVLPVMIDKGAGAIVNIGSIAALRGGTYVSYAAAKGGVHAMTVDMAYSHGRQGIRVNAIAPGHITTPLMYSVEGRTPETDFRQRLAAESSLLGTEGFGYDVGWAAAFLASDEARWITGVTLPVDGGVMAVTPLMMAGNLRGLEAPAPPG